MAGRQGGGRISRICLLLLHNRANFNPSLILLHFSPKDSSLPPQHYLNVTQLTVFMVRHIFTRQRGDLMASASLHLLPVTIPKKLTAQAPKLTAGARLRRFQPPLGGAAAAAGASPCPPSGWAKTPSIKKI